ncbi:hypothetical protein RRG08_041932 [Elysia crispata]|uniref:Uncharacterized protein n=1 Tax=Elysia crispata TaxID=231223 RepID=A0AAE0XWZ5_9GAST|nr:hypothetical protein RRG08_041932 [Elysia crispata]
MIVSIRKTASVGTKFIKISTIIDKSGTETEVDRTGSREAQITKVALLLSSLASEWTSRTRETARCAPPSYCKTRTLTAKHNPDNSLKYFTTEKQQSLQSSCEAAVRVVGDVSCDVSQDCCCARKQIKGSCTTSECIVCVHVWMFAIPSSDQRTG